MQILNRLFEISIYSMILFFMIMVIKKSFKNKMSPTLHFVIWFLLIARLCIPVTIDSGVRLIVIPEKTSEAKQIQNEATVSEQDISSFVTSTTQESIGSLSATLDQEIQEQGTNISNRTTSETTKSESSGLFHLIQTIEWTDVVLIVWVAGIFLRFLWALISIIRMRHIVLNLGIEPTSNINDLLEKCKRDLSIKKNIPLYLLPNCATPALTVWIKPKMILPLDLIGNFDEKQIQFAIRHELMHYKRKDHLFSILLRILEAIYWFNPVVWLMNKCIISDMETACDSMVVDAFDKNERKQYAFTLLHMFSQKNHRQLLLGMSLNNTERIAEKRIRGVFMKNKSKWSVKFIAGVLSVILFVACFTTACQPTPEEDIVVGKGDTQSRQPRIPVKAKRVEPVPRMIFGVILLRQKMAKPKLNSMRKSTSRK